MPAVAGSDEDVEEEKDEEEEGRLVFGYAGPKRLRTWGLSLRSWARTVGVR